MYGPKLYQLLVAELVLQVVTFSAAALPPVVQCCWRLIPPKFSNLPWGLMLSWIIIYCTLQLVHPTLCRCSNNNFCMFLFLYPYDSKASHPNRKLFLLLLSLQPTLLIACSSNALRHSTHYRGPIILLINLNLPILTKFNPYWSISIYFMNFNKKISTSMHFNQLQLTLYYLNQLLPITQKNFNPFQPILTQLDLI